MQDNPEKSPIYFKEYKEDKGSPNERNVLEIILEESALQDIKTGQGFMSLSKSGGVIIIKSTNFTGPINTVARKDLT